MQKTGIDEIIRKLKLREKDPDVCESWDAFWLSVPREIDVPQELTQPFEILVHRKNNLYCCKKIVGGLLTGKTNTFNSV